MKPLKLVNSEHIEDTLYMSGYTTKGWEPTQGNVAEQNNTSFRQLFINSVRFGLPPVSTTLCVIGTFANLTSLIYFIKKKDKTIGDKLLMLLNSVDLLLCICATVHTAILTYMMGDGDKPAKMWISLMAIGALYYLLIDGTAYVTCLLSVTRAIGIVSPFYQIRGKLLVILGIIVFVVIEVLQMPTIVGIIFLNGMFLQALPRLVASLLVLLTVLCATILAVHKLTRADLQGATENVSRNNRKATWTVVILSVLFLFFNSILLGVMWQFFVESSHSTVNFNYGTQILFFFVHHLAIPINSTINPIVYLTRKSDMRQFFIKNFQKFCRLN